MNRSLIVISLRSLSFHCYKNWYWNASFYSICYFLYLYDFL